MNHKPILILYSELAEYTLACLAEFTSVSPVSIHLVKWPVKNEAPFEFRAIKNIQFYNREELTNSALMELAHKLNPNVILVSGWMDKGYINVCKNLFGTSKIVLTLDNHWSGGLKQQLKTILAKYYFKNIYSHAWVPGKPQLPFVKKLGFRSNRIYTGFYSADIKLFKPAENKSLSYNFIYVGRYLNFKGIFELWNAFKKFKLNAQNPWKLHCVGTGDLWEQRVEHPDIIHHGFLQPQELKKLVDECDVFVLPSHKEPWGVVVHEMAACGLTLLCSDKIGAATAFLEEGKNGFSFESNNADSLGKALKKVDQLSSADLKKFSQKSIHLAQTVSPKIWAETLLNIAAE